MSSSSFDSDPQKSLGELKIRSKILVKAANNGGADAVKKLSAIVKADPPYQHKDGLKYVARTAGFRDWQHAAHILSGNAKVGEDMGTLWYSRKCMALLNIWCRDYNEALEELSKRSNVYLLPYKRQFIIVDDDFMRALGLLPQGRPNGPSTNRDLIQNYGTEEWDNLTFSRLQDALGPT